MIYWEVKNEKVVAARVFIYFFVINDESDHLFV
jgi:hypothetical protein